MKNLLSSVHLLLPSWMQKYEKIAGLMFLGLFVRIVMSFYTSSIDEEVWYITAVQSMLSGQGSPYGTWYFSYPPVWAYIYLPFVDVGSLFSNPYLFYLRLNLNGTVVPITSPLFNLFVKLPLIVTDIFVGLIIYQLVRNLKDEQAARKSFIFWFLNPFTIFTGALLAQFDVLPALTSLLAFVFFMQQKYFLSGVSIGVAIMAKIYPIYFIPLYITFFFRSSSIKKIEWKKGLLRSIRFLVGVLLTGVLILIPILATNSFHYFYEGIFRRGDYITAIGGITPLNLIYLSQDPIKWINENSRLQMINILFLALQMVGIALVSFHFAFRSKQEQLRSFLIGHLCILALVYLTIFVVNPQYIIWVLPFLILSYGFFGNHKTRLILLSASACFLAFYWAYPLYPIIVYVNKEIGMLLNNTLNLTLNPTSNAFVLFFGFIGGITILLLPFSKLDVLKEKIRSISSKMRACARRTFRSERL